MSSNRPFVALALAETFSISGSRLATIAIPWLVLTTTGSAVLTGVVALVEMLPSVIARALGGPLLDRLGARRVAIGGDLLSMLVLALIPLLHAAGALHIWLLLPIVFVLGALRGPTDGAKLALVPEVAERAGAPLERVTGVVGMIERLGSTVGAALAGGLVALIGPTEAMVATGIAFVLSAALVAWGMPRATPLALTDESPDPGYFRALRDGFAFLRRDPVLIGITLTVAATNLIDQGYGAVLAPVWSQQHGGGAALLGLLFAVFSAASIGGAALATVFGPRLPRLAVYTIAFLLTGLPRFAVLAFALPLPLVFATLAVSGFASGFLNPILGAVIFERIPKPLLGRVSSLTTALGFGLTPFGGVLAGLLTEGIGLSLTLLVCGGLYLLAPLLPLASRGFRAFGKRIGHTPG